MVLNISCICHLLYLYEFNIIIYLHIYKQLTFYCIHRVKEVQAQHDLKKNDIRFINYEKIPRFIDFFSQINVLSYEHSDVIIIIFFYVSVKT